MLIIIKSKSLKRVNNNIIINIIHFSEKVIYKIKKKFIFFKIKDLKKENKVYLLIKNL